MLEANRLSDTHDSLQNKKNQEETQAEKPQIEGTMQ
jgi:hypothetical protein